MAIYYVYILRCVNKKGNESLYTGSTDDLVRRIGQHQKGRGARYTKSKDLELVYFETYSSRSEAMKREYEIKQFTAEQKRTLIIKFKSNRKTNQMDVLSENDSPK